MDKTKHGLRISHFWLGRFGLYGGEREKGRREEEENPGLEIMFGGLEVWNSCLETSYSCLELWFGIFAWICWLGNYLNSFFVYIWVRNTLTLQYMGILLGLSQFWGWF